MRMPSRITDLHVEIRLAKTFLVVRDLKSRKMKLLVFCSLFFLHVQEICALQNSQTCDDLNTLIENRNPSALLNCTTNDPACDSVTCSIPPGFIIETATLTVLSCVTPPAINIVVSSSASPLLGNFTFTESRIGGAQIIIIDGQIPLAQLDVDVEYSPMDAEFIGLQVNVTVKLGVPQTIVLFSETNIALDSSVCDNSAVGLKVTFAGMMLAVLLALMSSICM